jgi:hypothetical protein
MENYSPNQIVLGNEKYPIVISLTEYKGSPLIDIRKYYFDKKKNEIKPSKKGIALQKNNFNLLVDSLINSSPEIKKWFEEKSEYSAQHATKMLQDRAGAFEDNRRKAQKFETDEEGWQAPNFFDVETLGGSDRIIYNTRHGLFKILEKLSKHENQITINLINSILMSYKKAKDILDDGEEYSADELFKYLEFEWGIILSNYIRKVVDGES